MKEIFESFSDRRFPMPYINIKITREGTTAEQKAELIKGATELLDPRIEQKSEDHGRHH